MIIFPSCSKTTICSFFCWNFSQNKLKIFRLLLHSLNQSTIWKQLQLLPSAGEVERNYLKIKFYRFPCECQLSNSFPTAKVAVEGSKLGGIDLLLLFHPSFVTPEDVKGSTANLLLSFSPGIWWQLWAEIKVPTAIFGAEIDNRSPPKVVEEFFQILQSSPVRLYAFFFGF